MQRLLYILLVSIIFGTVTDIDGNVYETVQIGEQLWMAENLKVTHYQNSDEIPYIYNDPQYGAYINYSNNADNVAVYGRLYNWLAINDERGLCPANWHVPSDDEFKSLEMYLGMSESEANSEGLRGTDEGGKLKEEGNEHWNSPNTGATNEIGFTALPGGNRRYDNYTNQEIFCCLNRYGFFWSSSEVYTVNAWYRALSYDYSESNRYHLSKANAFSVRCISDEIQYGCTDEYAINYDEDAIVDDGSCLYPPLGDINNDGIYNILDVIIIINFILAGEYVFHADLNADDNVNILDIILLVNWILDGLSPMAEECFLEPDIGPCDGVCPRYFYNQETEECEVFMWGCCDGVVPFDTLEECEDACE